MGLSQRAALVTVALVGAATTAAAMLAIDQISDEPQVSMPDRPTVSGALETGSLPRESLYPEPNVAELEFTDLAEPEVSRFEFAPPDAFDPSAEQWPPVVRLDSEDESTWSTQTHTARTQGTPRAVAPATSPTLRSRAPSP